MGSEYILEAHGIRKIFPGVVALNNVELCVRKGTIHALMGENGAGKSTLMKILIGIYKKDGGSIEFKGKPLEVKTTKEALEKGISMIHQELSPVPRMTVAENIYLGRETGRLIVDKKKMVDDTKALFEELEIELNPKAYMYQLTVSQKQLVEIAKAISYHSDLIIMDEPTSSITEKEVDHLFKMMRKLKARGVSIIYITHKMDELYKIVDEISVYRDGTYVGSELIGNVTNDKLISMMVGRTVDNMFPKIEAEIGEVVLSVKNVTREGFCKNVSFDLRKGEILGFAGLVGAGRTEVMEALFGLCHMTCDEYKIHGKNVSIHSPEQAIKAGLAFLTEDRRATGIFPPLSIRDNMIVTNIDTYLKGGQLDKKKIEKECTQQVNLFSIKTPSLNQKIENLSGGNQQKVLISRWLLKGPDILIIDEPTRGIDVGAKSEIHKVISELAGTGKSVIMISSELPEVLGMSDRVVIMHEGMVAGIIDRNEATQALVMEYATGLKTEEAR